MKGAARRLSFINDLIGILRAKQSIAAWRVLVGLWIPKRWDLSLSALAQFTKPKVPPPNPWIDRPLNNTDEDVKQTANPINIGLLEEPAAKGHDRKPPSRRLIRHVLRARVEATNALAAFFDVLSRDGWIKQTKASPHLARTYRGEIAALSSGAGGSVQDGCA